MYVFYYIALLKMPLCCECTASVPVEPMPFVYCKKNDAVYMCLYCNISANTFAESRKKCSYILNSELKGAIFHVC